MYINNGFAQTFSQFKAKLQTIFYEWWVMVGDGDDYMIAGVFMVHLSGGLVDLLLGSI